MYSTDYQLLSIPNSFITGVFRANSERKRQKMKAKQPKPPRFLQVSHIHKVDGAKVLIYSESASAQKDFTSSSMIAPVLTPCSCACAIIHSRDSSLILQHTGTLFSQNPLRPAPSRLPPQVFLFCFITIYFRKFLIHSRTLCNRVAFPFLLGSSMGIQYSV